MIEKKEDWKMTEIKHDELLTEKLELEWYDEEQDAEEDVNEGIWSEKYF